MSTWILVGVVVLGLVASGVFSGSETGLYSVSRSRLDLEAGDGKRGARLVRRLTRRRAAMLVTILIGNNLALELMTLSAEELLHRRGLPLWQRDLMLTFVLTPTVFLFGELLPKDLFRRRPHDLMRLAAPLLVAFRLLVWPLERVLRGVSVLLERSLGLPPEQLAHRPGRTLVLRVLAEGRAVGALAPHAEELARNALGLRSIPVTRAMIPWASVSTVDGSGSPAEQRQAVETAPFTRLPVRVEGRVTGYVHQLEVLGAGEDSPVLDHHHEIQFLDPLLPVDRALARLRVAGARAAVVGSPEEPQGLVTLKDLLEEISGDLGGW